MFLFKYNDGHFAQAPEGFDPKNPNMLMLKDVSEVLVISKVLTLQTKLTVKSKQERDKIRASFSSGEESSDVQHTKRGRRSTKE